MILSFGLWVLGSSFCASGFVFVIHESGFAVQVSWFGIDMMQHLCAGRRLLRRSACCLPPLARRVVHAQVRWQLGEHLPAVHELAPGSGFGVESFALIV